MKVILYRRKDIKLDIAINYVCNRFIVGVTMAISKPQQDISEPVFYGDLAYKFKRIVGKPNFSDHLKKIIKSYKRVRYNMDIMQQSACMVVNSNTLYSYGFLFNCTTVGQAPDSMTALK